ncbi:TlpA family protein disulfide reductase [Miltoncostaea marina]|uniref:TlpA family protein disulfide reductase n=1 Tax=Miltoncostaea marina TaxID=2843215 RepID=UPI001C3D5069|nr:TlpA disulfide reductase family protein [Miltoncostaea marina]
MEHDEQEAPPEGGGWDRRRAIGAAVGGVVVLAVIALLVIGLVNRDIGTSIQDALDEGERPEAPGLTLPVLIAGDGVGPVGSEVSLEDLRGRTVVLNFWASWCEPCKAEAPVLERIASRYRPAEEVLVLGVDVQDVREKALGFARDNGLTYPSLRDGEDDARKAFQVPALPETFVIDPQGRIALKVSGPVLDEAQITNAVGQLQAAAR